MIIVASRHEFSSSSRNAVINYKIPAGGKESAVLSAKSWDESRDATSESWNQNIQVMFNGYERWSSRQVDLLAATHCLWAEETGLRCDQSLRVALHSIFY